MSHKKEQQIDIAGMPENASAFDHAVRLILAHITYKSIIAVTFSYDLVARGGDDLRLACRWSTEAYFAFAWMRHISAHHSPLQHSA